MATSKEQTKKLWGGRFRGNVDPVMDKFNESLSFDQRMAAQDVQGSKAYAVGLTKLGILTEEENQKMQGGLDEVAAEWSAGKFLVKQGDEDIHTANERRLIEIIGANVGGKLHTGRSRNDQVATDMRLYMKDICKKMDASLRQLMGASTDLASQHLDILMPGFTHLQPAQPVRFSHWLMSHVSAFRRDLQRLREVHSRMDVLPLGSGALAGNAFGIDRDLLKTELGFASLSVNSLDAVSDRDFVSDFMYWASMTMVHLSQLSEDLIFYNTLKCVEMADAYSTGSSLMPQKKNPDALELLRGKTGRVIGRLNGFMITMKGMPRSYNKDLQEDKEALFDVVDTISDCLEIATGVVATMSPVKEKLQSLLVPEMLATDLAEYLVRRGVPFRETHHIAGAAVRLAEDKGCTLSELTATDLRALHPAFDESVQSVWDFETSVERKDVVGGTSKSAVQQQIEELQKLVGSPENQDDITP